MKTSCEARGRLCSLVPHRSELICHTNSGSVHKVFCELKNADCVLKTTKKPSKQGENETNICRLLISKSFYHPNIVSLYDAMETPDNYLLLMEYASRGDMNCFLSSLPSGRLAEQQAKKVALQVSHALSHLHQLRICHRDLKPSNIFLTSDFTVKVGDLGMAAVVEVAEDQENGKKEHRNHVDFERGADSSSKKESKLLTDHCGTMEYCAPEVLLGRGYDGFKADVWSLGVTLYTLVVGQPPFISDNPFAALTLMKQKKYKLPKFLSSDLKNLLKSLLVSLPHQRLSLHDILAHPWLQGHNFTTLSLKDDLTVPKKTSAQEKERECEKDRERGKNMEPKTKSRRVNRSLSSVDMNKNGKMKEIEKIKRFLIGSKGKKEQITTLKPVPPTSTTNHSEEESNKPRLNRNDSVQSLSSSSNQSVAYVFLPHNRNTSGGTTGLESGPAENPSPVFSNTLFSSSSAPTYSFSVNTGSKLRSRGASFTGLSSPPKKEEEKTTKEKEGKGKKEKTKTAKSKVSKSNKKEAKERQSSDKEETTKKTKKKTSQKTGRKAHLSTILEEDERSSESSEFLKLHHTLLTSVEKLLKKDKKAGTQPLPRRATPPSVAVSFSEDSEIFTHEKYDGSGSQGAFRDVRGPDFREKDPFRIGDKDDFTDSVTTDSDWAFDFDKACDTSSGSGKKKQKVKESISTYYFQMKTVSFHLRSLSLGGLPLNFDLN